MRKPLPVNPVGMHRYTAAIGIVEFQAVQGSQSHINLQRSSQLNTQPYTTTSATISQPDPLIHNVSTAATLTAMSTQARLTYGLHRSPTRAHFQNRPSTPVRWRSMGPGNVPCA